MAPGERKLCQGVNPKVLVLLSTFVILVNCNQNKNFSPNPIGGRFVPVIRPSQSLLPPHREEGQSLDDIIYGFSSPLLTPPKPLSFTTTTTTTQRSNNVFITPAPTLPPPPPPQTSSQGPFIPTNSAFGNVPSAGRFTNNNNVVQTFTPPPAPRFSPTPAVLVRNSLSPNSAEEIKVPQPVKLRNDKKQYTKADLVAAANSLKPAGFDFSKLVIITPSNFQNKSTLPPRAGKSLQNVDNNKGSIERAEDNTVNHLYQHVMFPLPLFDTPVFRPIMEMLLRQQQAKLGSLTTSDNKKVLVIIPKSAGIGAALQAGRSASGTTNGQQRDQRSHPNQSKQASPKFSPQVKPTTPPSTRTTQKFVVAPKAVKVSTTTKPKSNFLTTKRVTKQVGQHSGKIKEKGPDLQVAATSNKLSQRSNNNNGNPSSSEKRSYSIKGDDKYSFSYAVKNDAFGDIKSHSESRDGDQVEGEYSMLEADGYTRIVRYTVDSDQGFKASVRRIPPS